MVVFDAVSGALFGLPSGFSMEASGGAALHLGSDAAAFDTALGASIGAGLTLAPGLPLKGLAGFGYTWATVKDSGGGHALDPQALPRDPLRGPQVRAARARPLPRCRRAPALHPGFLRERLRSLPGPLHTGRNRLPSRRGRGFHPKASGQARSRLACDQAPHPQDRPSGLQIIGLELEPVFPVFFRYCETNPLGCLILRNSGPAALEGLQASLPVKQFMDDPKESPGTKSLAPGAEARRSQLPLPPRPATTSRPGASRAAPRSAAPTPASSPLR